MAVLQSGNLSFDFQYAGFEHGWVQYQFFFLWKGEPIIRDESLKRWSKYWDGRPVSAFLANTYKEDCFLPILKKLLESDEADYWEPIEPDIVVAIYPDGYFPFLKSHTSLVYESEESKRKKDARRKLKEEKGKLPDDSYTFIAFVDAYNLKEADAYYGQGLSLQMIVSREDLEIFANNLDREYTDFKKAFKVDEWGEENA